MEIVYVYQRKRREFGRQPLLQDRQAELTIEVPSDNNYMSNYVIRNPCQTSIQCVPDMSEHEVETIWYIKLMIQCPGKYGKFCDCEQRNSTQRRWMAKRC